MAIPARLPRLQPTAVALAVCAVCASARAETGEQQEAPPAKQEASVSVGVGGVTGSAADRARFGQYNGLRDGGPVGLLGLDYSLRETESGIATLIWGSDLAGKTPELDMRWKKQGEWKFSLNYGQLLYVDPNTVNTGVQGIGTMAPEVVLLGNGPGSGNAVDLQIKRTRLGLGFSRNLSTNLLFDFSVKTEDVEGARFSGRGVNCPSPIAPGCAPGTGTESGWAVLMLPEPVNANHTQLELRMNYAGEKFRLSGGYYGSFYNNAHYGSLNPNVPGTLNNPLGTPLPLSSGLQALLNQPIALPPNNQSQQVDLTGGYDFSHSTHSSFKLSRMVSTQSADFVGSGLSGAPAGVSNLDARVVTTQAQLGLTSRPTRQLSLLANLRYEDRDDQTPIEPYNIEGTSTYTNRALPRVSTRGKLQANYQIDSTYRAGLGADYEAIDRGVFTPSSAAAGVSALRQKTDETGVYAELRRSLTDNLSGELRVGRSHRYGSNWLQDNSGLGVTEVSDPAVIGGTAVYMPTLADRTRDKVRLLSDWQASEALSLQFTAEGGRDTYSMPTIYGAPATRMNFFGVDGSYAVSEAWSVNGYLNQGRQTMHQARPGGYLMDFANTTWALGLGFSGKPMGKLEVGGMLSWLDDRSAYDQGLDVNAGGDSAVLLAATGGLPDITYRQTRVKLFGKYTVDKRSSLRLDIDYMYSHLSDWTWGYNGVPFTYSDGTTVTSSPVQRAAFVGVSYVYRWE